ncbi:HDIG domain-containing protein [Mobilitalea sibirica]|uniref:HDIG domain-containing protein n=1 Tax=Mobilitalea sibirica TaxID=1462919 RepID=A0A8J7H5G6_9FIRM|nr:HDIG domain-containing metalloprotein [Mobilitalea sibirica]MBH1940126.1 HDIG domain-containing protein [Mobilitalea sibirica]
MIAQENRIQSLYEEITQHILEDKKPSDYLNKLSEEAIFKEYPFYMLLKLKSTEQSKKYHPEGSVWNHTMLVLDEAASVRDKSKDPKVFMWAALLHDIGKPDTTRNKKGKITSYDHDMVGAKLSEDFLHAFTKDENLIKNVSVLVRYHMHMLYILKGLPHGNPKKLIEEVDIHEITLLCRCDRMGRTGVNRQEEEDNYREFIIKLRNMSETRI